MIAPGTPQQNGVAERRNMTLLEMVRSMMSYSTLPVSFQGYALKTAMHILNLIASKSVSNTPKELWSGCKPSMKYLHIWGCPTHVLKGKFDKLEAKIEVCKFLGYSKETKGYLFYDHKDNTVFVNTYAKFLEDDSVNKFNPRSKVFLAKLDEPIIEQPMDETRDEVAVLYTPQDTTHKMSSTQASRCSGRIVRPPIRFIGLGETYEAISEEAETDPYTYEEAMNDIDAHHWVKAMKFELDSMYSNQV